MKTSFFSFISWVLTGFGLGIALMSLILMANGFSVAELQGQMQNLTHPAALVLGWANVGHQLGAFVFPSALFYWFHRTTGRTALFSWPSGRYLFIGAISLLVGAGCIDLLSYLNLELLELLPSLSDWARAGELSQSQLQTTLMEQDNGMGMLQVIIIIALVPAVFEEFFFRGALFQWLLQWFSPWKVMVISGFIFSLVHFQFEGFLPRWGMGVFLGYLTYQSQSLWPSILGHFVNNASGIFFYFHFHHSMTAPADHWMSSPIWWGISAVLMGGVGYGIWWQARRG